MIDEDITCTIVWQKNWDAVHALDEHGQRKYRYILNIGSSRSSKTISIIDVLDLYARSNKNKRITSWRDTKTDCKKTVLHDVLKRLKQTNRYKKHQDFNKTESIFTYDTESTYEMHGTDDEETVHGLTQDVAHFNEPYKISKDTFDQIDQRTSDFVIIDLNPKKGHWSDDLIKDSRTIVIHSTFRDNPFCPEEQKNKILSYQPVKLCQAIIDNDLTEFEAKSYDLINNPLSISDKKLKELVRCLENESKNSADEFKWLVYGLGLKSERPNRIYRWNEISLNDYLQLDISPIYGCDWGVVDPWALVECKYKDGNLYVRELNYKSENNLREQLLATERIQVESDKSDETAKEGGLVVWMLNKLCISKTRDIICDTNRPLKINALRRAGYRALTANKPAGSKIDGINILQDLNVFYTSDSENIKYEQENYSRKVDKYGVVEEEPEDLDDHQMDAIRYVALHLRRIGIIKVV